LKKSATEFFSCENRQRNWPIYPCRNDLRRTSPIHENLAEAHPPCCKTPIFYLFSFV